MSVLIFEDRYVDRLQPITTSRPAFAIRCGSYRLCDLLEQLAQPIHTVVRPHLRQLVAEDYPGYDRPAASDSAGQLVVNARLVPSIAALAKLKELLAGGRPAIVQQNDSVAAALVSPHDAPDAAHADGAAVGEFLKGLKLPAAAVELPLLDYPHDVIRHHVGVLAGNLQHRLATGEYREIADGVFAAPGANLGQYCVIDTSGGPIVLEEEASIGPYCYLSGPVHVGHHARVIEHAAIKDHVELGHTTKIGGEVEASIVEPYTNKQHHGFLGHSYLGSWINLGAGTCNSDLKNTYGKVNMEYRGQKVATGMQFVGCVMGAYSKTAINTGIFTGKVIGVCSMLYGFVTTNVPSFVNYARSFGEVTATTPEVMIATQARMFARRNVLQRPCDIQLIRDMYELTQEERRLATESLSL